MNTIKLQYDKFKISVAVDTFTIGCQSIRDAERHSNLQYEIHIPIKGCCNIDVEKNEFELKPGTAIIIAPGKYHSVFEMSNDFSRLVISFQVDGSDDVVLSFAQNISVCKIIEISTFDLSVCNAVISETVKRDIFWKQNLHALYSLFFTTLLRNIEAIAVDTSCDNSRQYDDRFSLIDNFFERNLSQNCSEEDLSSIINLSKRQLNRILMVNYGMGFREKLKKSRMDRAQWLLKTTNLSVSEICDKIGYKSEASFFKSFKRYYNVTPGKYREQNLNKRN